MRLCRYLDRETPRAAFYGDRWIVPLAAAAKAYNEATHESGSLPAGDDLLPMLPPEGESFAAAQKIAAWLERVESTGKLPAGHVATADAKLLVPIPRPNKLFLLAGNYNEHIREGGGVATERAATFPYVFMKPPSTTLTNPGQSVVIPRISPGAIDWELELAVVIGKRAKDVKEADALSIVAGYTVVNDISNRKFRPNPDRTKRDKDSFFDWLHGKWHDSFCPCGPCVTSADAIPDPQALPMKLSVNGQVKQDGSTGQMIFPVAALVEFIASIVTLEPGDIIATGTPSGVGNATGTYLHPGDRVDATIDRIGTLVSPIVAE